MRFSRTTLILLIANLVAFGLVWKGTYRHTAANISQQVLFPAAPSKVILTDGADRLVLEKRSSLWHISEPFDWLANSWAVQRLLDELHDCRTENSFLAAESKANGSSLEAYGLAKPRWTLKVTSETGTTTEVKIGQQASTQNVFLLTEDGQRIIPLRESMSAAIEAKPETYRVDKIFEVADFEARAVSVRLRNKGGEIATSLTSESRPRSGRRNQLPEWRFEAPYDFLADADATTKAVSDLANLRAVKFLPLSEDVSGLSNPALRLALEGNSRRQVLLVGNPVPGFPNLVCAKLEDNVATFTIEARSLTDWLRPREALAATKPIDFEPALVTGFTITSAGRSITLHRLDSASGDSRWEIPLAPGSTAIKRREADVRIVNYFLDALSQLRATRRKAPEGGTTTLPSIVPLKTPPALTQTIELEFGSEKIIVGFSDDPESGQATRLVYVKGSPLGAICDVSLLSNGQQNVEPQAWRNRTVAELPQGAKVSGLRITDRTDGKVLGEARLRPDGNWTGSGRLEPATARRLATGMSEVKATEFPTRQIGATDWKYELRITDQAATGAAAASETFRTYLCATPLTPRSILLRDETDGDDFLLETTLAEILTPLLETAGR